MLSHVAGMPKCRQTQTQTDTETHAQTYVDVCVCVQMFEMATDLIESQLGNDTPHACLSSVVLPLLLRHAKPCMETQELPDGGGSWQLWLLLCVPAKPLGMFDQGRQRQAGGALRQEDKQLCAR